MRKFASVSNHPIYGTFYFVVEDSDEHTIMYRYEDIKRIAGLDCVKVTIQIERTNVAFSTVSDGHVDFVTEDTAMIMIKEAKAAYRWRAKKFIKYCHSIIKHHKEITKEIQKLCQKI